MIVQSMRRLGITSLFVLTAILSVSCGEDPVEEGETIQQAEQCACEGGECAQGVCALEIQVVNSCDRYEEVHVFVNPTYESGESPTAVIQNGDTYRHCEGFGAPVDGSAGETFQFYVGSADKRAISNTQGQDQVCATEGVATWTVDLCPN